uniref:Uncharacterized protein n=1 Tax=Hyaloperonospora arabidopsidis (strain Emoy2) TaxID=559515 RepID=M4BJF2_HYAAE
MARKNAKNVKPSSPSATKEVVNQDKKKQATTKIEEEEGFSAPASGVYGWVVKLLAVVAALAVTYYLRELDQETVRVARYISRKEVTDHLRLNVSCTSTLDPEQLVPGCHLPSGTMCGRVVMDNFVKPGQVTQLREIAEIGMESRSKIGGPTIMDINTGFVRNSEGLVNIYQPERRIPNEDKPGIKRFTTKQFNLYRS